MAFSVHSPDDTLTGFFRKAGAFFAELYKRVLAAVGRPVEKIPPEKRRFVMISVTAVIVIVLLVVSMLSLPSKGGENSGKELSYTADTPHIRNPIPPDELFLPDEPDFIPGVLPERERRTAWTVDDAAPWWQDPLRSGEQKWRDQIETTIDGIMESVP